MAEITVKDEAENEVKPNRGRLAIPGKMKGKKALTVALVALALLGLVGTFVFYQKYQDVKSNPAQAQKAQNSAETQRVLAQLKKVLRVDETEAPTVARVEDPAKLKTANAEFYKNIEKGDYLVIFPKRAIIYRESANQIINIAPIIKAPEKPAEAPRSAPASNKTTTPTTRTPTR
jgi:hypothetical protein